MSTHQSSSATGRQGEDLAAAFLQKRGLTIITRNYRAYRGEIDIVAKDNDTLVFVEVKAGRSDSYGEPETWVTERKQQQIAKIALAYLQEYDIHDTDCRFDVVAIKFSDGEPKFKHIKDAFWL